MSKDSQKLPVMCNMLIVKKSNSWTMDEAHTKELNISRLTFNKINSELGSLYWAVAVADPAAG